MIRVGVAGANGRMGKEVCRAVGAANDMELTARIDPSTEGRSIEDTNESAVSVQIVTSVDDLDASGVDVIIDFTHLNASRKVLDWCAVNGVHAVAGTTGFTNEDFARFEAGFTSSNAVITPNFAIGAVLMMRVAELAAPHFETAEVIEFHHNEKRDAPSGTAMMTAQRVEAAKQASNTEWDVDPTEHEAIPGARGGKIGGVSVHGVRLHGMVASQEVLFGTQGETLTIRHDSIDRTSFMPGVLLAARQVSQRPGVTLGLDPLLFP